MDTYALELGWWDDFLTRSEPLIQDGYIEAPERPSLGVELNRTIAREHATGEGSMFATNG